MIEKVAYLDSSAIVKRYVYENGSEFIRTKYSEAYMGSVLFSFNVWNFGEVIGLFGRAHRQKRITSEQLDEVMDRFSNETMRLKKISRMRMITLSESLLESSWDVVIKRRICVTDALQITSTIEAECNEFYTGDEKLHKLALSSGLNSFYLG
ncbi:type II toxin-antitoxin system VapC family toxin [Cuniculiplasma sp. SKW3]|uniref:type II toxin-antitoxin system VapC family toxin n=1 Tax=Cuniculiplasma sp. SKW3 TaxID=3400170 RepID=UPI003FD4453F